MGDIVNLNKFRKQKTQTERRGKSAENRIKFGRTKAEKNTEKQRFHKTARELTGKKIVEKDNQSLNTEKED
ncbi:MAG: DUF4169 family protein [Sneathiella sp.]|nr:DUF4169 family protein [Sneathiella sp.]